MSSFSWCLTLNNPCHGRYCSLIFTGFFNTSDFPIDLSLGFLLLIVHWQRFYVVIHHTLYSIIKLFSQNCWPLYIEDDLGTSSNISYMEDIVIFKCCNLNNTTCLLYRWVKHFISNSILVKIFYFCCSFYNLDGTDFDSINKFLSSLVEKALYELECSYCIEVDDVSIYPFIPFCIKIHACICSVKMMLYQGFISKD